MVLWPIVMQFLAFVFQKVVTTSVSFPTFGSLGIYSLPHLLCPSHSAKLSGGEKGIDLNARKLKLNREEGRPINTTIIKAEH